MSENLNNDDHLDNDPTDELPILTDVIPAAALFRRGVEPAPEDMADTGKLPAQRANDDPGPGATGASPRTLAASVTRVATLETELAALEQRWHEASGALAGKAREIERLRNELTEVDTTAANQREALQQGLDELRARDHTIATLRQDLEDERDKVRALEENARALERQVSGLEAAQAASRESSMPTARDAELTRLRDEVAALSQHIENRNDSWRDQAAALERMNTRIRELELELAQRVERQLAAEQHAEAEATRAREARKKLATARDVLEQERERAAVGNNTRLPGVSAAETDAAAIARLAELETAIMSLEHELASIGNAAGEGPPVLAAPARLICLTGEESEAFLLNKPAVTIGRGPECEIQILTHYVSREHARISTSKEGCVIEDLDSRNGVFVNAVRIERQLLEADDLVTVGDTQFRFAPGVRATV
jgi:predicted  nucleic acid-binding Zn-ribbon protein